MRLDRKGFVRMGRLLILTLLISGCSEEQRVKWDWELGKGMIDVADILMEQDPDKFPEREDAEEHLAIRSKVEEVTEEGTSPLLAALTSPV